jgi:hypothetical protein
LLEPTDVGGAGQPWPQLEFKSGLDFNTQNNKSFLSLFYLKEEEITSEFEVGPVSFEQYAFV